MQDENEQVHGLILIGHNQDTEPIFDEVCNANLLLINEQSGSWDPIEYKLNGAVEISMNTLLASIHMKVLAVFVGSGMEPSHAIWITFKNREHIEAMQTVGASFETITNAIINKEENGGW
tara:strand:+ start:73 stop:432 length:360 start_codon:yes stop_codon:yes gene_type:complete